MATIIDTLIVELGLENREFHHGIHGVIADLTSAQVEVGRLDRALNLTAQTLSMWRNISLATGGTVAGITSSIRNLTQQFEQFSITGESAILPFVYALGISFVDAQGHIKNTSQFMLELANRFVGWDKARAAAYMRLMGLEEDFINLVLKGPAEIKRLREEQAKHGVVTEKETKAAEALREAWQWLEQSTGTLGRILVTEFTPALKSVLDTLTRFTDWLRTHKPLLEAGFFALAGVIVLAIGRMLSALVPISRVATALGLTTRAALATRFGFLGLLAAGALLFDDWKTWMEGGKSGLGDFWAALARDFKALAPAMADGWKAIKSSIYSEDDLDTIKAKWAKFWEDMKPYWEGFQSGLKRGWDETSEAAGPALDELRVNVTQAWNDIVKIAENKAKELIGWLRSHLGDTLTSWLFGRGILADVPEEAAGAVGSWDTTPAGRTHGVGMGDVPQVEVGGRAPASIRYNNPGAQYPAAAAKEFGMTGYGVIGGGHLIAQFPTPEQGAASNMDLLARNYAGLTVAQAESKWTGGSAAGVEGFGPGMRLTPELLQNRDFMIAYMKSVSKNEAGRAFPMTDEQWGKAFDLYKQARAKAPHEITLPNAPPMTVPSATTTPIMEGGALANPMGLPGTPVPFAAETVKAFGAALGTAPMPTTPTGAAPAAVTNNTKNQQSSIDRSSETHIGSVTVNTQATDAPGIARDIGKALERTAFAAQADYSLA